MSDSIKSFENCVEYRAHLTSILANLKKVCDADDTCRRRLLAFAKKRGLPVEFLDEHGIFYLSEEVAKEYGTKKKVRQPDTAYVPKKEERDSENLWRTQSRKVFRFIGATVSVSNRGSKNMLENRVVYPLFSYITQEDKPLVCGVCGYDMADGALAKYIYCQTPYFDRVGYLYGEEDMLYAPTQKAVFVGEGLVDRLWLKYAIRQAGYNYMTLAVCGVTTHDIKMSKLGLISDYAHFFYFQDRDESGEDFANTLVKKLSERKVTRCYVRVGNKDVAEDFSKREMPSDFSEFVKLLSNIQDGLPCGASCQV